MNKFYRCECFVSHNVFLKDFRLHVKFLNEKQFWTDYDKVLQERGMKDRSNVLSQVQTEVKRRLALDQTIAKNTEYSRKNYQPLHPEIFTFKFDWFEPEFLEFSEVCADGLLSKSQIIKRYLNTIGTEVYTIRALRREFCAKMVAELDHYNSKVLERTRPNTMNTSGVVVEELGLLEFVNSSIQQLLAPISRTFFPEWHGDGIDSHKSFTLKYARGQDTELAYHYDNAEVTFNFCLGTQFSGAEVYFTQMKGEGETGDYCEAEHETGVVLFHRARHMHGTQPLLSGTRYNLLMWLRSSSVRNKLCPMCDSTPKLLSSLHMGDGFTVPYKEVT